MVTDYLSGKPVDGAIVTYYGGQRRSLQELGTVKTDREGLATLPANSQVLAFQASRPGDTNAMLTNIYPMGSGHKPEKEPGRSLDLYGPWTLPSGTNHFLQRSRLRKDSNDPHAVAGQTFTVTLYDANGKELAQKKFTTNDFGSFNGEFSIPKQTLSGVFRLSTGQMSVYIHVENTNARLSKRTSSRSRAISLSAIPLPYKARRLHFPACHCPAAMSLGVLHAGPSCCGSISVRALRHR